MDSLNRLLGKPTVVNEQNKWEDNPGRTSQISLSASNIGNDKVDSIVAANLIIEMPPIENKDGNNGDVDGNSNNNNSARNTGESLGSRKNSILLDKSGQKQLHKSIEDRHYEGTPESTMELLDFYVYTEEFLTQTLVLGVKIGVKVPDKIPQKLVKLGANINFVDPITKKSPLMIAICNYDSKMALLLLSLGAKYELVDKFKSDAITYAIYYGLPTVVDAIMDKITGGDHDGTKGHDAYKKFAHTFLKRGKPSPLVYAIQQKREAIALKLIDFGADIYSTAPVTDEPAIYTAVDNKLLKVVDSMLGHHIDLKSENEKGFYPLHCAIDNSYHLGSGSVDEDYVTLSKKLIEYGAPINAASGLKLFDGATPLIVAAKNKNTVITEILLEKGAQLGIKDKIGRTALHYAALRGEDSILHHLIERGADVNQTDDKGSTPILLAGRSKEEDELRFLLERNALLKMEVKGIKVKPILMEIIEGEFVDGSPTCAAALGCVKAVIEAKRPKFDINERHEEDDKFCPLIVAARDNKLEIVRYLLSCKYIKIDKIDKNGKTALHHACERRLLEMVTLLLDKGADPTINDSKNYTPIMICCNVIVTGPNAISSEENNTNLAIAEYVLKKQIERSPRKLNIGEVDLGRTALHLACLNGLFFMVQKLVPAEADVDCTDHTLKTPLMYCALADPILKDRTLKIAEFLMANHCNIEQATAGKKTMIHFAAKSGRKDLLIKLVAKGVNVDVEDKRGMTPLMFAVQTNSAEHYDAAKYLVEVANADLYAKDKKNRSVFHHAAFAGNDSFTEYLVKRSNEIAPKDKDEKKKMDNLLSAADASESSAIQFAAKNRRKGVVAILLGATKTKDAGSDDVGVSDKELTKLLENAAHGQFEAFNRDIFVDMMRMKANVNMPMYRGGSLDVLLYNLVISARDIVWSAVQKGVAVGVSGVNKLEHLGHELKDAIIDGTDESRKQNEDGNGEPEEVVKVQKIAPIFDHGVHTLLEMASKYPHETFNIISSMAPVRSHRIICRDFKKPDSPMVAKLDEGQYIIATTEDNVPRDVTDDDADDVDEDNDGGPLSLAQRENQDLVNYEGKKDCFRLWYNRHGTYLSSLYASVFGPEEDAEVESFTIEIPYISSLEFLQAVIIIANKTANKEIFNHEVVKVAIFNAWNDFGYAHHMWHFFFFLVGIIVNSVTNYRFLNMVEHEQFNLLYANLGITGLFLIYELVQMYLDIFTYFMSVNNLMDLSAYVLVLAGNVLRTINHRENNLSAALLSVGCLMLYFDFLFYLGPFHSTGYLIGMIKAIMWGIRYYLFILAIVVFGFSQSLFVLSFAGDNQFSTPQMALLSSFTYMMGAASYPDPNGDLLAISPFYPTYINSTNGMNITMTNYSATGYLPQSNGLQISNPELATFLIVMLVFITAIVMLNLLISIMGYEFSRVQEEAEAEWRKEVCNTILDQLRFVKPKVKQFTHFLKRKLDIKKEKEQVKVSSVIGELRDQFYPMKFKSELHRHEMHRMTQDDSGYIRITCNVCFKDIDGEGDDLFYNCKTCVYSTHLHCAMPMVASDVKVDRFAASVDKKIKNMFSEIRDQIYPDTCSCGQEHSADHTLTRSVIKKSTRNPMYCGVCRRGIVGEEDDDLYYGCTSCAFDTHLKCSVSTYRNDSARFSSIEKQLAAIVNHLGVKE